MTVGERGGDHAEQPLHLAVDHHGVKTLFAAEVLVDDRFGDAGLGRDLLDRRTVEASLSKQAPSDTEQLLSSFGACHPLSAGSWC